MFTENITAKRKQKFPYVAFTGEANVKNEKYLVEIHCITGERELFTATATPLGYVSTKRRDQYTIRLTQQDEHAAIFPLYFYNPFAALAALEEKFEALAKGFNGWVNWETWYLYTAITSDEDTLLYFKKLATADELAQQFKNLAVRTRVLGFSEHNIRNVIFRDIAQSALENVDYNRLLKRIQED